MTTSAPVKKAKRAATSTVTEQVRIMVDAAAGPPPVPPHIDLPPGAVPFWESIVATRARSEWSSFQLTMAAQLARTQYDIERRTRELEIDGVTIENQRGTPIANPLNMALEALVRRQLALVRSLQLTTSDRRVQSKRDAAYQTAKGLRDGVDQDDTDDLLA